MSLNISESEWKTALTSILEQLDEQEYTKMLFCSCFGKIPKSVKTSKPREEMPQTLIQFLGVDKSISAINEAMEQIPRMDSAVQDKLRPFVNKLSIKQEEENKDQPMSSQPDTDHILTNQELRKGDFLISENGKYKAVFQEDGNFVIFALCPIWATGTAGENPHRIIVQPDNNLVMYNGRNKPVWASDTWEEKEHEHSDKMCLTMTNEGKLVLDKDGEILWSDGKQW